MDFEYTGSGKIFTSGCAKIVVVMISIRARPVYSPFVVVMRLIEKFYYRLITRGKGEIRNTLIGHSA